MSKVMTAQEATKLIKDGSTIAIGGFVGSMHPEELSLAIEESYLKYSKPKNLSLIFAAGQGDGNQKGLNHLGHKGLLSKVIGGHWALTPKLGKLALNNDIFAYNLPQGVISHMYRDIAAGKPGTITKVGLNTFVDPRVEGGKINDKTTEDIVKCINLSGEEWLYYPCMPIDVVFVRGTYADLEGNCTFEKESLSLEMLSMCQAAKNSGGIVILQVERIVERGSLDYSKVKIPGIYIDAIVEAKSENHMQSYIEEYNPTYSQEIRIPMQKIEPLPLDLRKIIARRAVMELHSNTIVNLGIGIPEGISIVAAEEGIEGIVLTTEAGTINGIPAGGLSFGASTNPDAIIDQPYQFDFYDGGGLDIAFLGMAQCDKHGNINVSKFGPKVAGCGGFINISQNTQNVVFCGSFTAGGLDISIVNNEIKINREGKVKKFIQNVEQITFSGKYAIEKEQSVKFITERAVFELVNEGMKLTEIAPGINLEKDILNNMDFEPIISKDLKIMDIRIFNEGKMGINI